MCKIIEEIREEERIEAFQEGKQEGFQEGKQEGFQEGKQDRDKELVLHMLGLGESLEKIATLLGRSLET